MRSIYFRGKNKDKWVYLNLFSSVSDDIDIKTISQFTGLYDSNFKEIFEGDILKTINFEGEEILYIVEYFEEYASFVLHKIGSNQRCHTHQNYINQLNLEIIGNIYDNSELLKY